MIRRQHLDAQGVESFVLIPQIAHAHLAADLAYSWNLSSEKPWLETDGFLDAISHHDDGWEDWDQAPEVDAAQKVPVEFCEVSLMTSMALWRKSIALAEKLGHLARYAICGHFCELLRNAGMQGFVDPGARQAARNFLQEHEGIQKQCQLDWEVPDALMNANSPLGDAVGLLQFFDALSLHLCCRDRAHPKAFRTPTGTNITITPAGERKFRISPWPFGPKELNVAVMGRQVPAVPYEDKAALAACPGTTLAVDWNLVRDK